MLLTFFFSRNGFMDHFIVADDRMSAKRALRLIDQGGKLLWRGDFHNGKQLLAALKRRLKPLPQLSFHEYRRHQAERVGRLNSLLVAIDAEYCVRLRRAPDVRAACAVLYEPGERVVPLRELLGLIGAHQLRLKGIEVPALGARIHPHYGVFAPTRSEYVELVARQPLPQDGIAFDIGTGTGVLAALIAQRGSRVVATDNGLGDHLLPDGESWLILSDLAEHLGLRGRVELLDLFARAGLVVAGRADAVPTHRKATDPADPLQRARAKEVTSLWRLKRKRTPQARAALAVT